MTRKSLAGFIAILLIALCAPVSGAATVPTKGKTWKKGSTLKVYSKLPKRYDLSLVLAIKQYNGSGAKIKLKRVSRSRGANIKIQLANIVQSGLSTYGRPRNGASNVKIGKNWDRAARGDGDYFAAVLLTHEIGHSLGLDHPKANVCSAINSAFFNVCKRPQQQFDEYVCGILQKPDKKALVKLYGGKPSRQGSWYCKVGTKTTGSTAGKPDGISVEVIPFNYSEAAKVRWTPVAGKRIKIERRDTSCSAATKNMATKQMMDSDAWGTFDSNLGVVSDPFAVEASTTVCYWLFFYDTKTDAEGEVAKIEATLQSAAGTS